MRLGDYIDDHCTRCKRTTDHSIAAMVGEDVQKVICRICHSEHPYRHNENPKKELTKEAAFNKVLGDTTAQIEATTGNPAAKKRTKTK